MALQLQWGLEQTSNSTLEVAAGLLRAATTDNVQPLAILACEQFGNTLAIHPSTLSKVEHTVLPTPKPAVVSFLQSTVGYAANDCTTQFGKSVAGLQFLALATALITTLGASESGAVVQEMLASTARDKTFLPTLRQTRDLLNSLEARCQRASIADDVVGWHNLLKENVSGGLFKGGIINCPDRHGIQGLVDALRQLRRIGDENITGVTIQTNRCAAWTMAFVKWSLGYPPNVIKIDGTPLLKQAGSAVTVILTKRIPTFCVTVYSSIHGPSDLISSRKEDAINGMVSFRSYGDLLKYRFGFDTKLGAAALREALPRALYNAVTRMAFVSKIDRLSETRRNRMKYCPFPEHSMLVRTCALLFGETIDGDLELPPVECELPVDNLPAMTLYLNEVRRRCKCMQCCPKSETPLTCRAASKMRKLNSVVADVLCLSLFECPEELRISTAALWMGHGDAQLDGIFDVFYNKKARSGLHVLLDWTLRLCGSGDTRDSVRHHSWVASSCKGQTVWPTIFDSPNLMYTKKGFLSLSWLPGTLRYGGDFYSHATSPEPGLVRPKHNFKLRSEGISQPVNCCPNLSRIWNVSASERSLEVSLGVDDPENRYSSQRTVPWDALMTLTGALLPNCDHKPTTPLQAPLPNDSLVGPLDPELIALPGFSPETNHERSAPDTEVLREDRRIRVVAVDGNDGLRFVALSGMSNRGPNDIVMRGGACLQCCLDVCRETGATIIVV